MTPGYFYSYRRVVKGEHKRKIAWTVRGARTHETDG